MKTNHILVIHGPNLNLLGTREPEIYGKTTLKGLNELIQKHAKKLGLTVTSVQSNHEGEIIDHIQSCKTNYAGLIINGAGYTHTSVAIRDALMTQTIPKVEVHISNIHQREEFRHTSLTAPACIGQITGFGPLSYNLGLQALIHTIKMNAPKKRPGTRTKL